jgi:hypothetical protein
MGFWAWDMVGGYTVQMRCPCVSPGKVLTHPARIITSIYNGHVGGLVGTRPRFPPELYGSSTFLGVSGGPIELHR